MNPLEQRLTRYFIGNIIDGVSNLFGSVISQSSQAKENEKDRQFNAEQAQTQRDWQERMYNDYQSPQAQVNQRLAAGLNPTDGVTTQQVGSGSTASSSSSPLPGIKTPNIYSSIIQSKLFKANTDQSISQAQKLAEETAGFRLDNFKKQVENVGYEEAIKTQRALLRQQYDSGLISYRRMLSDLRMFESFEANGGNTYSDDSNLKQSEAFNNNASAMRTQLLSLPEKLRIESETRLNDLAYELEDTFGRRIKSAMAQSSESDLEKLKIDLREYIANSKIRRELVSIGLEDAKATLLSKELSNVIESIDLNTIRSIVGDGSDPRSVFYGIFKKFFGNMP